MIRMGNPPATSPNLIFATFPLKLHHGNMTTNFQIAKGQFPTTFQKTNHLKIRKRTIFVLNLSLPACIEASSYSQVINYLHMDKHIGLFYKKAQRKDIRKLNYFFYCFYLLTLFYISASTLRIIFKKLYYAI